jgi:hypothetical protein
MQVVLLDYEWVAQYNDGTILTQYVNGKEEHAFKDINQSKLRFVFLIPLESSSDTLPFNTLVDLRVEDIPNVNIKKVEVTIINPHGQKIAENIEAKKEGKFWFIKRSFIDIGEHIIKWKIRTEDRIVEQRNTFVIRHERPIVLHFDPSYMRLILVRRHYVRGERGWLTWLFGWQGTIKGKNVTSILYIQPNGKIDISENFDLSL